MDEQSWGPGTTDFLNKSLFQWTPLSLGIVSNRILGDKQHGTGDPYWDSRADSQSWPCRRAWRESKFSLADEVGKGISSPRTVRGSRETGHG